MHLCAHGRSVDIGWEDDTDHISRRIQESRDFYERGVLEDAYERAPAGLVVDAGAHIGNHTLWFAAIMERDVVAFEPHKPSAIQLESNVVRNRLSAKVTVYRKALGPKQGTCYIGEPALDSNSGSRSVVYEAGDVEVVTLDSLSLDVAVMKVDVEGCALAVLEGAKTTISWCRPLLYIETGAGHAKIAKNLDVLGYEHMGHLGATPVHIFEPA